MWMLAAALGALLIIVVLWDAFETIILPRRVARKWRITIVFALLTWQPWRAIAGRIKSDKRREGFLSLFGPLWILSLLTLWAVCLISGFALVQWELGSVVSAPEAVPSSAEGVGFATYLYMSGTTFFTLGFGDVTPRFAVGRALAVLESGIGFGFLAIVIGYLPVLYNSFSKREINISLLDARAGSPPSAAELLARHARADNMQALERLLANWEQWSAELLESHLSYPVLSYFRSQHNNQSWLTAVTAIMDTCAIVIASDGKAPTGCRWQAQLTFAMARHAVIDLSQVFNAAPQVAAKRKKVTAPGGGKMRGEPVERLPAAARGRLQTLLESSGVPLLDDAEAMNRLDELRSMYEPYVAALSEFLLMSLPEWSKETPKPDNWQTSAWEKPIALNAALDATGLTSNASPPPPSSSAGQSATNEHAW